MLPDVQMMNTGFPPIDIDQVGVENIKNVLSIKMRNGLTQECLANFSAYCSLKKNIKGINMSRIGRAIMDLTKERNMSYLNLAPFVNKLMEYHKNDNSYIMAEFNYIVMQKTPISSLDTPKPLYVKLISDYRDGLLKNYLVVKSTEMSLCPCSKEMSLIKNNLTDEEKNILHELPKNLQEKIYESGFGAHNQKSIIEVCVELNENPIYIEDILEIIESSASSPTYSILKREDEKYVTELSYYGSVWNEKFEEIKGGPRFVEDIARYAAQSLNMLLDNREIRDYKVSVRNQESIHCENIQATAIITAPKELL